ncbi:MAG: FtsB family cell division protein [Holosporales bacterium]
MLIRELKRRSHRYMWPALAISISGYFVYHLLEGAHGIFAWQRLDANMVQAKARLMALKEQHDQLERRVQLMRPGNICPDLLSEQARKVLGFVNAREVVVLREDVAQGGATDFSSQP